MIKKIGIFLILLFIIQVSQGVVLPIPSRPKGAMNGTEFEKYIENMPLVEREDTILSAVTSGNVPEFERTLIPITVTTTFDGKSHTAIFNVIPDYLAIGTDTDYFLIPLTPLCAQRVADLLHCNLPTRRMSQEIAAEAKVRLFPYPIPPSPLMSSVSVFWDHNTLVKEQRAKELKNFPLGNLVCGDKKDVVVTIRLATETTKVAIVGWYYPNGAYIQPQYLGHGDHYTDYSHGIRLIDLDMTLDGVKTTVPKVLTDPVYNVLLSDEGIVSTYRYNVPYPEIKKTEAMENTVSPELKAKIAEAYGKMPILFVENKGQTDTTVKFYVNGASGTMFFTPDSLVTQIVKRENKNPSKRKESGEIDTEPAVEHRLVLKRKYLNVNKKCELIGIDPQPGKINIFRGSDSSQWKHDIPTYKGIKYQDLYPGINAYYNGGRGTLDYSMEALAKSDPNKIWFTIEGADKISIDSSGDLIVKTPLGDFNEKKPDAYQEKNGKQVQVDCKFTMKSKNKIGFTFGKYDKTLKLVIN